MIPYNKKLVQNAQRLRKNMTDEEKHLWYDLLQRLPFPVKRQHNIESFIVDFYIPEKRIVIEVDGRQHLTEEHAKEDSQRDCMLASWNIKVLRYTNESIRKSFSVVAQEILKHLDISFSELKARKK